MNDPAPLHPLPATNAYLPQAELHQLFPSPVLIHHWPDCAELNSGLKAAVLAERARDPGTTRTNRGGWHSKLTLQEWPDPAVQDLMERVRRLAAEMTARLYPDAPAELYDGWQIRAWANINGYGAYNESHQHPTNIWSGVYYVDPGTDSADGRPHGRTVFEDESGVPVPGLGNQDPLAREFRVTPRAGTMLLFPSLLYHRVEPYLGRGERMTVAFNLRHSGYLIPSYDRQPNWRWRYFLGPMLALEWAEKKVRRLLGR